jgi:hypothetical protein
MPDSVMKKKPNKPKAEPETDPKLDPNYSGGAPIGNQFWKLRSKHGRDKIFATPEIMWQAACEYFEWCDENPLIEVDYKGKDADKVEMPRMRAYTLMGLCLYLGCGTGYFNDFEAALAKKTDEISKDFSTVITRIRDVVYNQKFTGAAANMLNANIIARDLQLREQSDVNHRAVVTNVELTADEAKALKEKLNNEF